MLENLYKKAGIVTRMISAENPTGEKGKACLAVPNKDDENLYWSKNSLGEGFKVNPFIRIKPKTTITIADVSNMGEIKEMFFASDRKKFSELILRIYFDNEEEPTINCPLGAFFCIGHDNYYSEVYSLPIVVAPYKGCSSYFEMPFRSHFKVEIENTADDFTWIFAYKIIYQEIEIDDNPAYFSAQYNKAKTDAKNPIYTILDGIKGEGVYVGTYLAWTELNERWWGEGEVKFYLDGDTVHPTICDNGTEDYFGGAWNFGGYGVVKDSDEIVFNSPFLGLPLAHTKDGIPKHFSMYRFHILDSIGFKKDIKVTIDTIGWKEDMSSYEHHSEEIESVAYYYKKHKN